MDIFLPTSTLFTFSHSEWLDSQGNLAFDLMNHYPDFPQHQRSGQTSGSGGPSTSQQGLALPFVDLSGVSAESAPNPLETILQQILTNVVTGREPGSQRPFRALASIGVDIPVPFLQVLHGNPGDYAWGSGGLDAVISQLLNNLDSSGPPPMAKHDIQNLPSVGVSRDQVEKNLQCSVCMEDFKLEEQVKQVPCGHLYHRDCIVPWLEMHGSCPICRKLFNSTSNASENDSTTTSTSNTSSTTQASSSNSSGLHYEDLNEYD